MHADDWAGTYLNTLWFDTACVRFPCHAGQLWDEYITTYHCLLSFSDTSKIDFGDCFYLFIFTIAALQQSHCALECIQIPHIFVVS